MIAKLTAAFRTAEMPPQPTPAEAPASIPWLRILIWFTLTRLVIWGVAGISLEIVPPARFFNEPRGPLDWLMHWDAQWFLTVARDGYEFDPTRMSNVNFLPVYPMLVRAATFLIRDIDVAAYVVSHISCFIAAGLLWRLTRDVTGRARTANYAVAFFLLGPVAVFYASMYSESTFMVFALASMIAARRGSWAIAGLCGAGAALSRSIGLFMVIPLAIEYVLAHRDLARWRSVRTWLGFALCGLPAVATAGYFLYLGWKFNEPRAYFISQQHGGHIATAPWKIFKTGAFRGLLPFYKWWFGATAFAGLGLTMATGLLRLPWSFIGFAVATCTLYLSIDSLEGIPRFFSIVFPFYLVMGIVQTRWPKTGAALLVLSTLLMIMSVCLFTNGYWFT